MTKKDQRAIVVYATFPSRAEANTAARALVQGGLAACVNILPAMTALYEWEGALEEASEVAMLIKTSRMLETRVVAEVERLHSYDTPAVLVLGVEGGSAGYLDWLVGQTAADAAEKPRGK